MDKRSIYESLIRNGSTPIRCCSKEEANQLIDDMCSLFPTYKNRLRPLSKVFGAKVEDSEESYDTEVVYRFEEVAPGKLVPNFCTYEYYRRKGYEVVDFCDIFSEVQDDVNTNLWAQDNWLALFE